MIVFTVLGVIFAALLALTAVLAVAYFAVARLKGVTVRRYQVTDPYADSDSTISRHWTLWAAKRSAHRHPRSRIFQTYDMSYLVAAKGWSESRNGYMGLVLRTHQIADLLGLETNRKADPQRTWESTVHERMTDGHVRIDWLNDDTMGTGYVAAEVFAYLDHGTLGSAGATA